MLAIAWGCLIQIVYFTERESEIIADGCYVSRSEFRSCYFTGDSVLCCMDQDRVKLLYTTRFMEGTYQEQSMTNPWENLLHFSQ